MNDLECVEPFSDQTGPPLFGDSASFRVVTVFAKEHCPDQFRAQ